MKIRITARKLDALWDKSKGLIGENKPSNIIFSTTLGIHTFGMKFPIDVILLDDNFEVVTVRESLYPNKLFIWGMIRYWVLETDEGFIKSHKIITGMRTDMKFI